MTTSDGVTILPEPTIEFGLHQRLHDPHDGLALFGPFDAASGVHPKSVTYAAVGTPEGLSAFRAWSHMMRGAAVADPLRDQVGRRPLNETLWPAYPGFEAAFLSTWPESAVWEKQLDRAELLRLASDADPNKRAFGVVNSYLDVVETALRGDARPVVIVCIVPEEVWLNCRPESRVVGAIGDRITPSERSVRRAGQTNLFDSYDPEQYRLSVDFRRQMKARVMEYEVPIQIVRETTLRLGPRTSDNPRLLTPLPDRAWILSTALYYKAGAKPWKLAEARPGVCYIGVAFRKPDKIGASACCAAQMFLDSGDGIVFMGEEAPMYSDKERQFHLTRASARKLLAGVLKTYKEQDGRELREIFLHYRSEISGEEFQGYKDACPPRSSTRRHPRASGSIRAAAIPPRLVAGYSRHVLEGE
jgi:hypothetical protein